MCSELTFTPKSLHVVAQLMLAYDDDNLFNKILKGDSRLKELKVERAELEAALQQEAVVRVRTAFPGSELTDDQTRRAIEQFVIPPAAPPGRSGSPTSATTPSPPRSTARQWHCAPSCTAATWWRSSPPLARGPTRLG